MMFHYHPLLDQVDAASRLRTHLRKVAPLTTIFALHVLLFYVVLSGMGSRLIKAALPEAILVTMVTTPPSPPAAPPVILPATLTPPAMPVVPFIPIALLPREESIVAAVRPSESEPAARPSATIAPAPSVAPTGTPRTITTAVEYIRPPAVVYPQASRRLREEGLVVLRILIDEKGQAAQVIVQESSGSARLDHAACHAAKHAMFKPYMENGRAIAVFAVVPLRFNLSG